MMALADWQEILTGAIDAERLDIARIDCLQPVPGPSSEQGFSVYRNNTRGARSNALADVYPVCRRLIGERSFEGLTRRFVEHAASAQGDLNRFGAGFGDFVAETVASQQSFSGLPWLGDLVRLEWLCHSVYYREDAPPLDLGPLQGGDPSSICPRPISCLCWMRSPWPVHQIWQAHQGHDEPPPMQIGRGDWYLVIERQAYQPQIQLVGELLWTLLDACGQDMAIGEMAATPGLDVSRLGELVERQWVGSLGRKGDVV